MPLGIPSLAQFEDDPFFGFRRDRFGSFDDFFSNDPLRRLADGARALDEPKHASPRRPERAHVARRGASGREDGLFLDPFSFTQDLFSGFDSAFRSMQEEIGRLQDNPDAHMYSHSSVMSYSKGEDGKPRFYEATSSNNQAPGGVRETRKTVRDSERELAKMALGRHLGSRAHVMEQSENTRTKQREEKQNFMGMEQNELESFDRDWQDKSKSLFRPDGRRGGLEGAEGRRGGLEGGEGRRRGLEGGEGRRRGLEGAEGRRRGLEGAEGRRRGLEGAEGRRRGLEGAEGRRGRGVGKGRALEAPKRSKNADKRGVDFE